MEEENVIGWVKGWWNSEDIQNARGTDTESMQVTNTNSTTLTNSKVSRRLKETRVTISRL